MNDDEIRALVRTAIQKHLGPNTSAVSTPVAVVSASSLSFGQYNLQRAPDDTMCLIEPAVRCNHCGYCKCHGH